MKMRMPIQGAFCLLFIIILLFGCTEKYPPAPVDELQTGFAGSSCTGCHLDKELLKKVATPIEIEPESGEG
ncbi:hypothetical protein JXJ21_13615 [candidate division KSB1 bacterium]|nr:hypothetical protein [candidate division KSB1 bacterium]